jgi:hypothetical protein
MNRPSDAIGPDNYRDGQTTIYIFDVNEIIPDHETHNGSNSCLVALSAHGATAGANDPA